MPFTSTESWRSRSPVQYMAHLPSSHTRQHASQRQPLLVESWFESIRFSAVFSTWAIAAHRRLVPTWRHLANYLKFLIKLYRLNGV